MQNKTKRSLIQLKALFPPVVPDEVDPDVVSQATQKNHKHAHRPARKPSKGNFTPALYRRRHLGKKR